MQFSEMSGQTLIIFVLIPVLLALALIVAVTILIIRRKEQTRVEPLEMGKRSLEINKKKSGALLFAPDPKIAKESIKSLVKSVI